MAQVINTPTRSTGLGSILGSSLGQGIGEGLAQIAQNKVERFQQNRLAHALMATKNFTPEQAKVISMFKDNPKVVQDLMGGFFNTGAEQPQQAIQQQPTMQQQLVQQQQPQQQQQQRVAQMQQVQQQEPQQPKLNPTEFARLQQLFSSVGQNNQTGMPNLPAQDQLARILGQATPQEQMQKVSPERMPIPQVGKEVPAAAVFGPSKKAARATWGGGTPKAVAAEAKAALDAAKFEESQKMHGEVRKENAFKFNKKYIEDTESHADSSRESEMRLDRLSQLNKNDKLMHPLMYSALKKVGLDIPGLQNADMQEFEKEKNAFLKNAKSIFGSRVTNYEMSQFLKTIPSLEQTQEGRTRVIRNLKLAGKAAQLRANAMRDIIKENKRVPPLDLQQQVEERIGGQLDKISQQFASGKRQADFKSITDADPSLYTGKTGTDHATGKKYKSDGTSWVEVQ